MLITGASSGYGLETARYFHTQGWRVVATMRRPQPELLPAGERSVVLPLDVDRCGEHCGLRRGGRADRRAGQQCRARPPAGILETSAMAEIRRIFETNTFGVMAMIQAVLPGMRERGHGVVINVTSSATLAPFPLAALYTADARRRSKG